MIFVVSDVFVGYALNAVPVGHLPPLVPSKVHGLDTTTTPDGMLLLNNKLLIAQNHMEMKVVEVVFSMLVLHMLWIRALRTKIVTTI